MTAIRYDELDQHRQRSGTAIGISDAEIVELATAFRRYGFWRIELDTGHFFGTPDIFAIFGMEACEGPMNMIEFVEHIHPEDLPMLMASYERTSEMHLMHHTIYRVRGRDNHYKFVRSVGRFREKPGSGGEIIGVTYEFFEPLRTTAFCQLPTPTSS